jgi:hypothetical protein
MPPIHANEVDGAVDAVPDEVLEGWCVHAGTGRNRS